MSKTITLNLQVDEIGIVKILLQKYVEDFIEGRSRNKTRQYALYEYLNEVSDRDVQDLIVEFANQENIEVVTLDDWKSDIGTMIAIIENKDSYKAIFKHIQHFKIQGEL